MDHLPYELVDRLLHFLPLKDLKTIRKAATGNPELETWAVVAEDHLHQRFFLDIHIYIRYKDEGEIDDSDIDDSKKKEQNEKIQLCVKRKFVYEGSTELWDFKNWRYAWIQSICIDTSFDRCEDRTVTALEKVLRIISLPVASLERSLSSLEIKCIAPSVMDTGSKILHALRKTFNQLRIKNVWHTDSSISDHLKDYASEGTFLQTFYDDVLIDVDLVKALIDKWLRSDMYLSVALGQGLLKDFLDAYGTRDGLIRHPSRRCSLLIERKVIVECAHYNLKQAQSLIAHWRNGNGLLLGSFRVKGGFRNDFTKQKTILLETEDIWDSLVHEYCQLKAFHRGSFAIRHHFDTGSLCLRKNGRCLTLDVSYKIFNKVKFETIIDDWMKGDGKYVTIGHSRIEMEIEVERERFPESLSWVGNEEISRVFIAHPTENARLKLQRVHVTRRGSLYYPFTYGWNVILRLSIVGLDPEDVADWNLQLLFGSLGA